MALVKYHQTVKRVTDGMEELAHDVGVRRALARVERGLTVEDNVEVVIQVSGKTRSRVSVPRDAEQGAVVEAAQRDAAVRRFAERKELRKLVYVPNRLLNLVRVGANFCVGHRAGSPRSAVPKPANAIKPQGHRGAFHFASPRGASKCRGDMTGVRRGLPGTLWMIGCSKNFSVLAATQRCGLRHGV